MNGPAAIRRHDRGAALAWPEALVLAAVTALCAYQLLVPPIVGMADNGDFDRVLEPLGLRPQAEAWTDRYFLYVNTEYLAQPRVPLLVFSTEWLIGELAKAVSAPFRRAGAFPLTALAVVHLALYVLGLYLILLSTQALHAPARAVAAGAVLIAAPDVAYIAMFNSFFTESPSLIFLVMLIGIALLAIVRGTEWRFGLLGFLVASALFVAAKPQNYPLAIPLAAFIWFGFGVGSRGTRRVAAAVVAVAMLAVMIGLQTHLPQRFRAPVLWDTVFFSILGSSDDPARELRAFGLDSSLATYQGVPAWAGHLSTPHFEVTQGFGFVDIARYYLTHPGRTIEIAQRCASESFAWHDPLIGNFTKDSGKPPRALAATLTGWSEMERRLLPRSLIFLIVFFAGFIAGAAWLWVGAGLATQSGRLAALAIAIGSMAVIEFAVVAAFSGMKDVIKHLYVFQVLFDVCLFMALAWLASRFGSALPWGFWRSMAVETQRPESR